MSRVAVLEDALLVEVLGRQEARLVRVSHGDAGEGVVLVRSSPSTRPAGPPGTSGDELRHEALPRARVGLRQGRRRAPRSLQPPSCEVRSSAASSVSSVKDSTVCSATGLMPRQDASIAIEAWSLRSYPTSTSNRTMFPSVPGRTPGDCACCSGTPHRGRRPRRQHPRRPELQHRLTAGGTSRAVVRVDGRVLRPDAAPVQDAERELAPRRPSPGRGPTVEDARHLRPSEVVDLPVVGILLIAPP